MFRRSRRLGVLWVPSIGGHQREASDGAATNGEDIEVIQKRRWREADARLVIAASQAGGKPLLKLARTWQGRHRSRPYSREGAKGRRTPTDYFFSPPLLAGIGFPLPSSRTAT